MIKAKSVMSESRKPAEPALSEMVAKDIEFTVSHPGPAGNVTIRLPAEDVPTYCIDPPAYLASHYGVARHDYLGWHASGYSVQCSGKRLDGKPCRGIVPGGHLVQTPLEWVKLQGEYCHTHAEGN